jgi:hypothetical protein
LLSIAPLSFDFNLQALDGLLAPSIHFLPSDKSSNSLKKKPVGLQPLTAIQ